jgi:cobalt-zinc-cadmium efflux system membrane fusion protein
MTCTRRTRSARLALLYLLLLAVPALPLTGCGRKDTAAEESAGANDTTAAEPGTVVLPAAAIEKAGIVLGTAGPATIDVTVELPGQVTPDSSRVQVVKPRFGGVVHSLGKQIGDPVARGETIARIQSNESLTDYAVTAAMDGRVVSRGATVGEAVTSDTPLYTIVDLTRVWVEFAIYPHQLGAIRRGLPVRISAAGQPGVFTGTIDYVGALMAADTRSSAGRVVVPNGSGRWEPGMMVTVTVITDHAQVAVAVPDEAVVRTAEGAAVFVAEGDRFRIRPVVTGRTDGRTTQITSGLKSGESIAIRNAFVLKAELEKAEFAE